ncbi:MAG: 3-deoxy-manno-octulosonate cytidylyltransferase, partial [Hyphomonadaceae bacterium]|nr:3-deoxy-manno-octulosonate cytidylyltransferase [Hyphomonadaceae bacterium]
MPDSPPRTEPSDPVIVIPARLAATRLPGKPLADIHGAPMIVRVIEQGFASGVGTVLVAAGDPEIVTAVEAAGHRAILTDPALPSGTDRILAALSEVDPDRRFDPVINLQGDMPTFDPGLVRLALQALKTHPEADIATLVSPSTDDAERNDPNVVKAVLAGDGMVSPARCLYFTRAAAPTGDGPVFRHVGLYVYRRAALERFVALPPSPLEQREKLEQLRALEAGMTIVAGL